MQIKQNQLIYINSRKQTSIHKHHSINSKVKKLNHYKFSNTKKKLLN